MCFCCCVTRKGILIYALVDSIVAFIFGIVAISLFGSKTDIYDALIARIDTLELYGKSESSSSSSSASTYCSNLYTYGTSDYRNCIYYFSLKRKLASPSYTYSNSEYYDLAESTLNQESLKNIMNLTYNDLEENDYSMVTSLKGIENGLGVVLFVFSLIFIIILVVYIILAWGIKETQLMRTTPYNILNGFKIGTMTLAIIFIFLAILYAVLLIVAMIEYISLVDNIDSCASGIIIGIIYGWYSFWYYIILSCALSREHTLFKEVGSELKPGPKAEYDVFGNPIIRQAVIVQQVVGVTPQIIGQPMVDPNMPYQQIPYGTQSRPSVPVIHQQQPSQEPMYENQQKQQQINADQMGNSTTGRKLTIKQGNEVNVNQQ